jgi:hypothetical protein
MGTSDLRDLDARVKRLERQNLWLKLSCLACAIAFVCMLTMGLARGENTVEAQKFVLRSAKGEIRAELSTMDGDYPQLILWSPNGQKKVEVNPLGLSVSDQEMSGKLPLAHYGDVGLYLTDGKGHIVLEAGGAATEPPQLSAIPEMAVFDKKGNRIWQAP